MTYNLIKEQKFQNGTSLVEILVTLFVLAIGALGVAALQLTGLKYNSGAYIRTQASLLSNDYMDRMRANRTHAMNNPAAYQMASFVAASATPPQKNCADELCLPSEIAQIDVFNWLTSVSSLLPLGQARVTSNVVNGQTIFSITLQWRQVVNIQGGTNANDELNTFTFTRAL